MKTFTLMCLVLVIALMPAFLFAGGQTEGTTKNSIEKQLTYWTVSGDAYQAEKKAIDSFNNVNPKSPVIYNPIPAGSSSEMIIQTAIATGTAPTIIANMEMGFGHILSEDNLLVALDTLPGFDELIKERNAESFVDNLKAKDGHVYVLPQTWKPALFIYDKALLNKAGFDKAPVTYSEFNDYASKLTGMGDYIAIDLDPTAAWWKVRYYWHTFYMSANGNKQEMTDSGLDTTSDVSVAFVEFVANAFKKGYASVNKDKYKFKEFANVGCISVAGSGEIKKIKDMRPDAEVLVSAPPVPDFIGTNENAWVDASVKGLAIIKNSGSVEKAWEYLKWRFSNPEFDLDQLVATGQLPMRADLLENSVFADYFNNNQGLDEYIKFVPRSLPVVNTTSTDVFNAVKKALWEPLAYQKKDVSTAIHDAEEAIAAMK